MAVSARQHSQVEGRASPHLDVRLFEGRKPGVISNNGIPILHELRFGSPTMPPVRRKRSASVPEGLHQLLDRNKVRSVNLPRKHISMSTHIIQTFGVICHRRRTVGISIRNVLPKL